MDVPLPAARFGNVQQLCQSLIFVKIETDEGLSGWGEAYTQADRDRTIEVHIQQLARYLVGRSPFDIKHFTFMAYTDFAGKRGAMDLYSAISGLEQAMKQHGVKSRRALARKLDVSHQTVQYWLDGSTAPENVVTVKLAEMAEIDRAKLERMAGTERTWVVAALDSIGGVSAVPSWLEPCNAFSRNIE